VPTSFDKSTGTATCACSHLTDFAIEEYDPDLYDQTNYGTNYNNLHSNDDSGTKAITASSSFALYTLIFLSIGLLLGVWLSPRKDRTQKKALSKSLKKRIPIRQDIIDRFSARFDTAYLMELMYLNKRGEAPAKVYSMKPETEHFMIEIEEEVEKPIVKENKEDLDAVDEADKKVEEEASVAGDESPKGKKGRKSPKKGGDKKSKLNKSGKGGKTPKNSATKGADQEAAPPGADDSQRELNPDGDKEVKESEPKVEMEKVSKLVECTPDARGDPSISTLFWVVAKNVQGFLSLLLIYDPKLSRVFRLILLIVKVFGFLFVNGLFVRQAYTSTDNFEDLTFNDLLTISIISHFILKPFLWS
jgi:hypothetical protein